MTYYFQKILGVPYYDARSSQGHLVFYWLWCTEFHSDFYKFSYQESDNGFGICESIFWFNFIYIHIFKKKPRNVFSMYKQEKNNLKLKIFVILSNAFKRKSFFQKVNKHVILTNCFSWKDEFCVIGISGGFPSCNKSLLFEFFELFSLNSFSNMIEEKYLKMLLTYCYIEWLTDFLQHCRIFCLILLASSSSFVYRVLLIFSYFKCIFLLVLLNT